MTRKPKRRRSRRGLGSTADIHARRAADHLLTVRNYARHLDRVHGCTSAINYLEGVARHAGQYQEARGGSVGPGGKRKRGGGYWAAHTLDVLLRKVRRHAFRECRVE